jgi:hypothetical protein
LSPLFLCFTTQLYFMYIVTSFFYVSLHTAVLHAHCHLFLMFHYRAVFHTHCRLFFYATLHTAVLHPHCHLFS